LKKEREKNIGHSETGKYSGKVEMRLTNQVPPHKRGGGNEKNGINALSLRIHRFGRGK